MGTQLTGVVCGLPSYIPVLSAAVGALIGLVSAYFSAMYTHINQIKVNKIHNREKRISDIKIHILNIKRGVSSDGGIEIDKIHNDIDSLRLDIMYYDKNALEFLEVLNEEPTEATSGNWQARFLSESQRYVQELVESMER